MLYFLGDLWCLGYHLVQLQQFLYLYYLIDLYQLYSLKQQMVEMPWLQDFWMFYYSFEILMDLVEAEQLGLQQSQQVFEVCLYLE